jgi:plastocyanin
METRVVALLTLALAGPAAGAEIMVTMAGADYAPASVTARPGDRLRFVNDDAVDHNVFVPTQGHAIDLGRQEPGKEAMLPLRRQGRFEVECVFHQHMLMVVEVVP